MNIELSFHCSKMLFHGSPSTNRSARFFSNLAFSLLVFGWLASPPVLRADTIETASGRSYRGDIEISQMTANSVTITVSGGSQQKVPAHTIKRITFDGEPNGLRSARSSFAGGQFNRVEEVLASVQPENGIQALEMEFLIAMANAQLALRGEEGKSITQSREMMETFVEKPNHNKWFQYFQALETFGDLEVASNNLAGAITQYQKLLLSSSEEVRMLGQFKAARVNVLLGKYVEAKEAFDQVQNSPAEDEPGTVRMKLLAKVSAARCAAETSDPQPAIQEILGIIKNEDPSDMLLFGNAYNALGHCYAKAGEDKPALLAFLHTDVLYQRDAEIHAEALFHLVKLWQNDQKPGQALEARKLLTTKYRNTFWGNKAQAERL